MDWGTASLAVTVLSGAAGAFLLIYSGNTRRREELNSPLLFTSLGTFFLLLALLTVPVFLLDTVDNADRFCEWVPVNITEVGATNTLEYENTCAGAAAPKYGTALFTIYLWVAALALIAAWIGVLFLLYFQVKKFI